MPFFKLKHMVFDYSPSLCWYIQTKVSLVHKKEDYNPTGMTIMRLTHLFNKCPFIRLGIVAFHIRKLPCSITSTHSIQFSIDCTEK